ncbi:hypothetical protein [Deinococcus pimensis]|uniref:hypothetical protein n=1 Tax=Deinococcus pimensis TaxID=309888 RepID=UPI0004B6F0E1|nr:hypothetical protein [Deinococcus pimensis]
MPKIRTIEALPESLHHLFEAWKQQVRADGKTRADGQPATNGDRSSSDLSNYERALKDFALGASGSDHLHTAHLTLLALEEDRILDAVIRGATQRRGTKPSPHLESSLRSWMRRVLIDMAPRLNHTTLRPVPGGYLWKPYRTTLAPFSMTQWPEGLKREFAKMEAAYADPFYVGPGHEDLQRHQLRPQTLEGYRRCLNRVVEYALTVEHLQDLSLLDLVNYDRALRVRSWYLSRKAHGGYGLFLMLCMALAAVARYLEITGQLRSGHDPFSRASSAPWTRFYRLARDTRQLGHRNGKISKLPDLPPLPPKEMEALALTLAKTPPRRFNGRPNPHQLHRRQQAATFYGLASGAPVRIKNWCDMQWGRNLYADADGAWWVYFRPEELKNGTTGREPREYRIKLPPVKAQWIHRWRDHLRATIGPDFEHVCPYVFPGRERKLDQNGQPTWGRCREDSFYRLIRDSCLEIRGHAYRPHAIRSDVTEHIVGRQGASMRSVLQAAALLGDSEQTVLRIYNKPDVQRLLDEDYFSELAKDTEGDA